MGLGKTISLITRHTDKLVCHTKLQVILTHSTSTQKCCAGNRAGFFLGDGAGVGKGRQIAAIIKEEHKRSGPTTRALWLSVSNDLRYDAVRDLSDVGAKDIKVFPEVGVVSMR